MIKGGLLYPRLCELGKIKIGGKGEKVISKYGKEFYRPEKYDHFVITKTERGQDEKFLIDDGIMKKIGDHCTELDVILLFDEIELNFPHWLAYYEGKSCKCSGDGEKARERIFNEQGEVIEIKDIDCKPDGCPNFREERCKPHGVLSVVLKEMNALGGVYKFRTGSWNSIQNLLGSMQMIRFTTGGILAGIPLKLVLRPQTVQPEGSKKTQVVYTVNLEFRGSTDRPVLEQLIDSAIEIAERRQLSQLPIKMLVEQRRKEIEHIEEEEIEEIADEYYPDNQERITNIPPVTEVEIVKKEEVREPIDDEIDKGFEILGYPEGKRKAMIEAYKGKKDELLKELNRQADLRIVEGEKKQ